MLSAIRLLGSHTGAANAVTPSRCRKSLIKKVTGGACNPFAYFRCLLVRFGSRRALVCCSIYIVRKNKSRNSVPLKMAPSLCPAWFFLGLQSGECFTTDGGGEAHSVLRVKQWGGMSVVYARTYSVHSMRQTLVHCERAAGYSLGLSELTVDVVWCQPNYR